MNGSPDAMTQPLEHLLDLMNASAVVGKPEDRGDVTVIPVAEVIFGLGFGMGNGGDTPGGAADATGADSTDADAVGIDGAGDVGADASAKRQVHMTINGKEVVLPGTASSGGGGGGGGRARPIGFIEIGPNGAKFEPIVDVSQIALAGIVLAGWIGFWVTFTVRSVAGAFAKRRD